MERYLHTHFYHKNKEKKNLYSDHNLGKDTKQAILKNKDFIRLHQF